METGAIKHLIDSAGMYVLPIAMDSMNVLFFYFISGDQISELIVICGVIVSKTETIAAQTEEDIFGCRCFC